MLMAMLMRETIFFSADAVSGWEKVNSIGSPTPTERPAAGQMLTDTGLDGAAVLNEVETWAVRPSAPLTS